MRERGAERVAIAHAAAALSFAAACLHGSVMVTHFREYFLFGLFFAIVTPLQVAWALLVHPQSGRLFPLRSVGETALGRHDPVTGVTPDIDLNSLDLDRTVSRRHAVVRSHEGALTVTETNAETNGTFVNGSKLEPFREYPLANGDLLQLALVTLRVHFVGGG